MKSKGGFFGIFKKKTTVSAESVKASTTTTTTPEFEDNRKPIKSGEVGEEINEESIAKSAASPSESMTKGIAKTSVIHYTPPGTVKLSKSEGSKRSSININVERRSNIVLADEKSMIPTPISQYDEPSAQVINDVVSSPPSPSTTTTTTTATMKKRKKKRMAPPPPAEEDLTLSSLPPPPPPPRTTPPAPPPPPPHAQQLNYEEKLRDLRQKFDEWQIMRIEEGGSLREEKFKAQVYQMHDELKKELEGDENEKSKTSAKKIDENRNVVVSKKGNSMAVDRLRKELEEQRSREKEVRGYQKLTSTTPSPSSPRLIEYHPMRRIRADDDDDAETPSTPPPPPIPTTRPPKLSAQKTNRIVSTAIETNPRLPIREGITAKIYATTAANWVQSQKTNGENSERRAELQKNQLKSPIYQKTSMNGYSDGRTLIQKTSTNGQAKSPIYEKLNLTTTLSNSDSELKKTLTNSTIYQKASLNGISGMQKSQMTSPIYQKASSNGNSAQGSNVQKTQTSSPIYQKTLTSGTSGTQRNEIQKTHMTSSIYQKTPSNGTSGLRKTQMTSPIYQKTSSNENSVHCSEVQKTQTSSPIYQTPLKNGTSETQRNDIQKTLMTSKGYQKTSLNGNSVNKTQEAHSAIQNAPTNKKTLPTTSSSELKNQKNEENFQISDILRAPKLRKVGMPVEKIGISMGKVIENDSLEKNSTSSAPASAPPPAPPAPPPPLPSSFGSKLSETAPTTPKSENLRDCLMSEIREAGRLRAARKSQNA